MTKTVMQVPNRGARTTRESTEEPQRASSPWSQTGLCLRFPGKLIKNLKETLFQNQHPDSTSCKEAWESAFVEVVLVILIHSQLGSPQSGAKAYEWMDNLSLMEGK